MNWIFFHYSLIFIFLPQQTVNAMKARTTLLFFFHCFVLRDKQRAGPGGSQRHGHGLSWWLSRWVGEEGLGSQDRQAALLSDWTLGGSRGNWLAWAQISLHAENLAHHSFLESLAGAALCTYPTHILSCFPPGMGFPLAAVPEGLALPPVLSSLLPGSFPPARRKPIPGPTLGFLPEWGPRARHGQPPSVRPGSQLEPESELELHFLSCWPLLSIRCVLRVVLQARGRFL